MKVIFHIGQPKTGTSKLQDTFRYNDEKLRSQGILYPRTTTPRHHGDLTIPIKGKVPRSLVSRLGSSLEEALAKSHDAWSAVGEQVRDAAPSVVILSSEFLFNAPHVEQIPELVHRHIAADAELTFLAYLRTPSEHYTSLLQQRVKASYKVPPRRTSILAHLDNYAALGDVVARKFSRPEMVDEDIVADACQALGIDAAPLERTDGSSNATVSAEGIILLQRYRQIIHPHHEDVFKKDSNVLFRRIVQEEEQNPGVYTKPKLRPQFAQLLDAETPETKQLEAKYGVALAKDHGVKPARRQSIHPSQDATLLMNYDARLLERMLKACDLPSLIPRRSAN